MSRTRLCLVTAAILASAALLLMLVRTLVLGDEIKGHAGTESWKVSLLVRGRSTGQARLVTACPLDVGETALPLGPAARRGAGDISGPL